MSEAEAAEALLYTSLSITYGKALTIPSSTDRFNGLVTALAVSLA